MSRRVVRANHLGSSGLMAGRHANTTDPGKHDEENPAHIPIQPIWPGSCVVGCAQPFYVHVMCFYGWRKKEMDFYRW